MCMSALLESPELQIRLPSAEQRGSVTSLDELAMFCLMQPMVPLTFIAMRVHCYCTFNLVSTRTLRSFSARLLSSWSTCRIRYCPLLSFTSSLLAVSPACPGSPQQQHNSVVHLFPVKLPAVLARMNSAPPARSTDVLR